MEEPTRDDRMASPPGEPCRPVGRASDLGPATPSGLWAAELLELIGYAASDSVSTWLKTARWKRGRMTRH